ncbi:MAG: hypothetical protein ACQGVC_12405 [Myxococcota bacterium]
MGLFAPGADAVVLADSFSQWNPGLQFADGWAYGWRNLATDPGAYDVSHFQLFLNDASGGSTPVSQNGPNHWDGTAWDFGAGAPWTHLGQLDAHPNGVNNVQEHWVIRRWSWPSDEVIRITWQIVDSNPGGSGVTGRLFLDGAELASFSTDGPAEDLVYYVAYGADQVLDFAITPLGVDGDPSDMGDGVETTIVIDTDLPPNPMNPIGVVADSLAGFSSSQGQDGWYYGYYDQRFDVEQGNLTYDVGDFVPFLNDGSAVIANDPAIGAWMTHPNHWSGSLWDLFDQTAYFQGPWTFVSDQSAQPAANGQIDPSVHWAVRRWVSDFEGVAEVSGLLDNPPGGDGVRARFLADGFEYHSKLSNGAPVPFAIDVPVVVGSVLDFALDADGSFVLNLLDPTTLDLISDTTDQSVFEVQIEGRVAFLPEPAAASGLVAGIAVLARLARRRRAGMRFDSPCEAMVSARGLEPRT